MFLVPVGGSVGMSSPVRRAIQEVSLSSDGGERSDSNGKPPHGLSKVLKDETNDDGGPR